VHAHRCPELTQLHKRGTLQAADLAAFLEPLLRFDADERPSAREALAHSWLQQE
jgi:serine/threonine protein kinase